MAPPLLASGILVVHRRLVLGSWQLARRRRIDAQVDPVLVDRRDRRRIHEAHAVPRRVDQQPVKDVLLRRVQHRAHGPHLLAVRRQHRHARVEHLVCDRQALIHDHHDTQTRQYLNGYNRRDDRPRLDDPPGTHGRWSLPS